MTVVVIGTSVDSGGMTVGTVADGTT